MVGLKTDWDRLAHSLRKFVSEMNFREREEENALSILLSKQDPELFKEVVNRMHLYRSQRKIDV